MSIKAVFATDLAGGFGRDGGLPWPSISEDLKHFKKVTMGGAIVMGYNTYKTLPTLESRTPLVVMDPERPDINMPYDDIDVDSFREEILWFRDSGEFSDISIIGGATILTPDTLAICDEVFHTTVYGTFPADTYILPETLAYMIKNFKRKEVIHDGEDCVIKRYVK